MGVAAQELSLEEVIPTSSSNGMLDDGKLDLVVVTVPETATVEVCSLLRTLHRCHPVLGAVAVLPERKGSLVNAPTQRRVMLCLRVYRSCVTTERVGEMERNKKTRQPRPITHVAR